MTSSLRRIAGHGLVAGPGHGGMARVHLAISLKPLGFAKLVVAKVLREEVDVEGAALLAMFIQEVRLAARINRLHAPTPRRPAPRPPRFPASAREPEPARRRPLDGNPWETPK